MPPQVNPCGPGSGSISNQTCNQVEEAKSKEPEKKPAESQRDSSTSHSAPPHRATPKEAASRKAELAMTGKMRAISLKNEKATDTLKGTIPDIAKKAVELGNAAARGIGNATSAIATANVVNQTEKANQHIQAGLANAREKALIADIKRVGSGNATYAEKEQLIMKIDSFRREEPNQIRNLYGLETYKTDEALSQSLGRREQDVKGGLTEVLGPYGYSSIDESRLNPGDHLALKTTQTEILDTALYNWGVSRPEVRVALAIFKPGEPLPADYKNGWKTPEDTRLEDRQKDARQVTLQNEPYDNQAYPAARPRETQTDPAKAYMEYKKGNLDAMYNIVNSLAGGGIGESSAESPGESLGSARTPHAEHGAPPEPSSAAETQPTASKSSNVRQAETDTATHSAERQAVKDKIATGTAEKKIAKTKTETATAENGSETNRMTSAEGDIGKDLDAAREAAGDHVQGNVKGAGRNISSSEMDPHILKARLRDLARKGDKQAEGMLRDIEDLERRQAALGRERTFPPKPDLMLTNNNPRTPEEAEAIGRWRAQQQTVDDALNSGAGEADVLGDQLELAKIGDFENTRGGRTHQVREALKNNLDNLPENIENELDRLENESGVNIRDEVRRLRQLEAEKIRVQVRTSRQLRDQ